MSHLLVTSNILCKKKPPVKIAGISATQSVPKIESEQSDITIVAAKGMNATTLMNISPRAW